MGQRKGDPPARRSDPLDHADQVALAVDAIFLGAALVAEREAAEEDVAALGVGIEAADRTLGPPDLFEEQAVAGGADPAPERGIFDPGQIAVAGRADLDGASAIIAGRRQGIDQSGVDIEKRIFPGDGIAMSVEACSIADGPA